MKSKKMEKIIKEIKNNYMFVLVFIIVNMLNSYLLRIITTKDYLNIRPILVDLGFFILLSLISLSIKREKRSKYFIIVSLILSIVCIINSVYYNYYSSFASISSLANAAYAKEVSNAILENVLKPLDLIYLLCPITIFFTYRYYKKNKYFHKKLDRPNKFLVKLGTLTILILWGLASILMPVSAWGRLYKLWNRESVVMNFGVYVYQIDDFIQGLTPKLSSMFGHDSAYKRVSDYYDNHKYKKVTNEYTDIFKGKNVIVIHGESLQTFTMNLSFNDKEVTPNLNRLAKEGIFFSNFYSEVGVGTSSDAEFTFNTSLMPSNRGTVFVNYFDRDYISIPKLLKEKNYYTFSMHANSGEFWNRNAMHKNLGYDDFYSKDSYEIDETIGLGLSDKSFFRQSVQKIKEIDNTRDNPYYGLLIMLSNHTPFSDLDLMEEYPTTTNVEIDGETITRDYLNETTMGHYIRSVHYADSAIGELIDNLDNEGLLDNTVIVIYGDHDARLDYNDYNLLYNYDPVTDTIKTEEDEGYIPYNKYNYELDRKVPFIIWTKDKQFNKEVNTPTGMIDVLPTLGNMLGIHSNYQIGNDIFNIKDNDNTVVFVDGSFLTSKIYYNNPKGEFFSINNEPVTEEYINDRTRYADEIIQISNDIISFDLIKELETKK